MGSMSERHAGYIVTLAEDIQADEAADIFTALHMIRGVIDVQPVTASAETVIAQARADNEWRERLIGLLKDKGGPK